MITRPDYGSWDWIIWVRIGDVEQMQPFEWWEDQHTRILWAVRPSEAEKGQFSSGKHKTGGVLDYIHSDFSRKVWVHFFKAKTDAFELFKRMEDFGWESNREKNRVSSHRNGLGYCNEEFNYFCKDHRKLFLRRLVVCSYRPKCPKCFGLKQFTLLLILSIDLQHQRLTLRLQIRYV